MRWEISIEHEPLLTSSEFVLLFLFNMFFWFAWVQSSEHLFHCLVWSTLFADSSICIHFIVKNSLTPQFLLLNEHFSQALFWEFAEYLKDVCIHWYCASLLHTLFIQECVQRVIKNIAKQYTVGGCPLTWCENITLGCTVTPIFLVYHFLNWFYLF